MSISDDGVDSITDSLSPYIYGFLRDMPVPDQQIAGYANLTNVHFGFDRPSTSKRSQFFLNPAANGIQFNTTHNTAHITADFDFSHLSINAKGTAKIDLYDVAADFGATFTTQTLRQSGIAGAIQTTDAILRINQDNITINLSGENVEKIPESLKS
jgi:membrane protease subunit (stomatin/prohibitin family)